MSEENVPLSRKMADGFSFDSLREVNIRISSKSNDKI